DEEGEGGDDGQTHAFFGQHVSQAGEEDEQQADDDPAAVEAGDFEGDDEGNKVGGEGNDPEERDGGDVLGEIGSHGAELHGGDGGECEPEEAGAEGGVPPLDNRERWGNRFSAKGEGGAEQGVEEESGDPEVALGGEG